MFLFNIISNVILCVNESCSKAALDIAQMREQNEGAYGGYILCYIKQGNKPGDKHISRLPLERGSLLNKNAYSMVCFSAAMRALLPENASPYLIIDLIPSACISAL